MIQKSLKKIAVDIDGRSVIIGICIVFWHGRDSRGLDLG